MHELVDSIGWRRLVSGLRLSVSGSGLPERLRSTIFALLGLTAAAGLALVAIFAQPGFPLLEPVPLPGGPAAKESIADAEKLPPVQGRAPSAAKGKTAVPSAPTEGTGGDRASGGSAPGGVGADGGSSAGVPAPADPAPAGAGSGGNGSGGARHPAHTATPHPAPTPEPSSPAAPASSPKPVAPAPQATASSPSPEAAQGPGNSSSPAAAEHASERGIEASSGGGSPSSPEAGAQTAAVTPSSTSAPGPEGQGNGYAKGQSK